MEAQQERGGGFPIGKKKTPKSLVEAAESQGWRVRDTKSGWMLYPPDPTKPAVLLHKTNSDHRWYANAVARLRRSGLDVD